MDLVIGQKTAEKALELGREVGCGEKRQRAKSETKGSRMKLKHVAYRRINTELTQMHSQH